MGLKFLNEDNNDYQVEKTVRKNVFARLRTVFLFILFLIIIFVLIKNNYSLSFNENQLDFVCGPNSTLNSSDDGEAREEKIARAIQANQQKISSLIGFKKVYSAQEPRGYQGRNIFVTKIIFSQESPEHKKIPEQLCGFDIDLVYK